MNVLHGRCPAFPISSSKAFGSSLPLGWETRKASKARRISASSKLLELCRARLSQMRVGETCLQYLQVRIPQYWLAVPGSHHCDSRWAKLGARGVKRCRWEWGWIFFIQLFWTSSYLGLLIASVLYWGSCSATCNTTIRGVDSGGYCNQ